MNRSSKVFVSASLIVMALSVSDSGAQPRFDPPAQPGVTPPWNPPPIVNPPTLVVDRCWTFESGTLQGWKTTGRAFDNQPTYGENVNAGRVKAVTVGGDYWKDIPHPIGVRGDYWIGSSENRHTSSDPFGRTQGDAHYGTLTSEPFDISTQTHFISFLIGGGKDPDHLKIELLAVVPKPKPTPSPNPGWQVPPAAADPFDYVAVAGIAAKTGHNNDMMRRDWWDVTALDRTKHYAIRITDDTSGDWGHINIDDIQFLAAAPNAAPVSVALAEIRDLKAGTRNLSWVDRTLQRWGSADLHTHPMSHLAMGRKLVHGAPDVGSIIPAGTRDCNPTDRRATSAADALGHCNSTHGGWGTDNMCGNYFRAGILNYAFDTDYVHRVPLERNLHGDHPHAGYPAFRFWPHWSSASHQQMYVDWIRRAYDGGLRVMVALSVNSELFGEVLSGDGPKDDKAASDLQLTEIVSFVRRHGDFMRLARSAEEIRQIVRSDRLAVVLGVELDNIGNFNCANVPATDAAVRAEIRRLHDDKDVRYIFPMHVVDNKFGGAAIYENLFVLSNKFTSSRPLPLGTPIPPGQLFKVERSADPRVTFRLGFGPPTALNALIAGMSGVISGLGQIPFPPAFDAFKCPIPTLSCTDQFKVLGSLLTPGGHVNQRSLTPLGEVAIREMMRLGMLIDIDHSSEKTANRILQIATGLGYPINGGHNGFRSHGQPNENARTDAQLEQMRQLGGMMGVGCAKNNAAGFLDNYRYGLGKMGGR